MPAAAVVLVVADGRPLRRPGALLLRHRFSVRSSARYARSASDAVRGDVPALDVLRLAWGGADVGRRRPDQPAELLLLHRVGTPAGHPGAAEHRGEHVRRYLGEVQDDGRPELDVGGEYPVRPAGLEFLEGRLLERLGRLVAGGAQFAGGPPQDAGARVLGPVDPVAEAHQALAAVEDTPDISGGVAGPLDLLQHPEYPGRGAAVQRAGQRADTRGDAGRHVGAGGGDHAGGERGGVHAVLGGRDEVGVDGLDVPRVGLAAPALHEPLDDRLGLVDLLLRHGRQAEPPGRLRDERQGGDADPGEVLAGLFIGNVQQLAEAPVRREHGDRGLDVDADVAGVHGQRERLGRGQARSELSVDQQRPDVAEGDLADQVFDVDSAIAQRAALFVGFGDLGFECDDAFETVLEIGHVLSYVVADAVTRG